ncbi:MAG TPA: hypothetical protein VMH50_18720, partial [Thermoleophilia bacterium]|nr:hypothetical protein [Thermoleophilia bacterium]
MSDRRDTQEDKQTPSQDASVRQDKPRLGERRDDETPWRVEGKLAGADGGPDPHVPNEEPRGLRWGRMGLALLGILALNWLIASLLFSSASVLPVSYTYFR